MLSLLGSLLGFGTSFLPKVMDYFQDRQDKAHEIAMLKAQAEIQVQIEEQRLEAAITEAQIREVEAAHREQAETVKHAARWLANLSGSIRPVVTYLFTLEYLGVTWAIAALMLSKDGITIESLRQIMDGEFMAMYSAMISFWFGNRVFGKRKT